MTAENTGQAQAERGDSRRVFKYEVPAETEFILEMPTGAKVLHVAEQGMGVCLWALVDPEVFVFEDRRFVVRGTGHLVPENVDWVGTWLQDGGRFVFHLFQEVR